jgi:GNAT superfamily N-acetyltransferase
MILVDLEPGDPRFLGDAFPVLRQLRPDLTAGASVRIYREGRPQGLRFSAVYLDNRCVGVAGWRVVATLSVARKLYVDDLVTDEEYRSRGVGSFLLAALTERAEASGCRILDLDSGVQRLDAHRFYRREGLDTESLHFARRLDRSGGEGRGGH